MGQKNIDSDMAKLIINFNDLNLDTKIGKGGFGVVYKGIWKGNIVAIKQIHEILMQFDENWKTKFLKEAKIYSTLNHPNIVQLYGVTIDPYSIITEFMTKVLK